MDGAGEAGAEKGGEAGEEGDRARQAKRKDPELYWRSEPSSHRQTEADRHQDQTDEGEGKSAANATHRVSLTSFM